LRQHPFFKFLTVEFEMRKNLLAIALLAFAHTLPVSASEEPERYRHHQGLSAETLQAAVTNFTESNGKLEKALSGKLDDNQIQDIHQLTYTLEKALETMNKEMDTLAETLEALHKASEKIDSDGVRVHGKAYLEKARLFTQ
jgi:predicted  nucleic acid-binding Zn-ribbon protein